MLEFRREDVNYRTAGANKDKHTNFLIGGVDYSVAKQVTATGRLGYQWRHRDLERSSDAPYAEFSAKFDYAQGSYFSAGYVYTFEETTNVDVYTDTKVNRLFLNLQHSLTPLIVASGSLTYEPSVLQGRRGVANADETTTRLGLAPAAHRQRGLAGAPLHGRDRCSRTSPWSSARRCSRRQR